jgi:glycosyltransferase involved in cell wall biosynthesis
MRVLYVSKPVTAPFHDGSICLVRDIALNLSEHRAVVMGVKGQQPFEAEPHAPHVAHAYPRAGGFAPGLRQNAHALAYLLTERRADLWHFVFAPNPRTSRVLAPVCALRRKPTLQTIASPPRDFVGVGRLLFGDVVVAQSQWCRSRIAEHAPERDVRVIVPPLGRVKVPTDLALAEYRERLRLRADNKVFVYPGDLEFSGGAQRVAAAVSELVRRVPSVVVVFACRQKTAQAKDAQLALERSLDPNHVRFAGELPSLLPLLKLADGVLFPVEDLWAKVDIPIAALETMALGTPLVTLDRGPLSELEGPLQVPKDDVQRLVEAAVQCLEPQARAEIAQRQSAHVLRDFDAPRVAAQYERLYDDLASHRR